MGKLRSPEIKWLVCSPAIRLGAKSELETSTPAFQLNALPTTFVYFNSVTVYWVSILFYSSMNWDTCLQIFSFKRLAFLSFYLLGFFVNDPLPFSSVFICQRNDPVLPGFAHWQKEFGAQFTSTTAPVISSFSIFQLGITKGSGAGTINAAVVVSPQHLAKPSQPQIVTCWRLSLATV